jgi:nucleotide-binding universal stress UspA family protein
MAFNDMLLVLTTYPEPTPISVIHDAVGFAEALGSRVSAIACEEKFFASKNAIRDLFVDIPGMMSAAAEQSSTNANELLTTFQAIAEKRGVFQERIMEQSLTSEIAALFTDYARLRDVTIVPVPEGDYYYQWYAEAIIFGSGRPTLIVPRDGTHAISNALNTVVVAWDFSRAASRALADALPILKKVKSVRVVTVLNEKVIESKSSSADVLQYLAHHGVEVELETIEAAGRKIGEILNSVVASCKADLLVMGAYGHSRIREFVLGGATRAMLDRPQLPIFVSH